MMKRNYSIDLFRGFAIIGMVLSAVFPWSDRFPAWMYHAQVGPPDFKFNPSIPGITWVDLVFPFFLFAMGAAFPLALTKKMTDKSYRTIIFGLLKRGILLVFFAITLAFLNPVNLNGASWLRALTALLTFFAYFLIFLRFRGTPVRRYGIQMAGFLIISILIYYHSSLMGKHFDIFHSDIIILILANMAVWGSVIWLLTAKSILARIAVMAAVCGLWLTKDVAGGWTEAFSKLGQNWKWIYNFSYLQYLCIVLPGSVLGDLLLKHREATANSEGTEEKTVRWFALGCFIVLVFHVVTLYLRWLNINVCGHFLIGILFFINFRKCRQQQVAFYKKLFVWGYALASIGLCFEPWQGGIKKDPSSFSYWFLSGGLAFIFYIVCDYLTKRYARSVIISSIVKTGQNPMLAYCAIAFFIAPLLELLHVRPLLGILADKHPFLGLIQTVVYLLLMIIVTVYATDRKWFWRS
ncbi:DUF5009 domain-containing protein [Niabella aquatica]